MRNFLLAFAASGLALVSCAAHADTFNFSATTVGAAVSGTLTATNKNNGSYLVTGISGGNSTGASITGLIDPGDPFFGNNNLLFPSNARILDVNGIAFTETVNGQTYMLNIYTDQNGFDFLAVDSSMNITPGTASFSVSSAAAVTPEPSSLLLLGTGMLGVVAAMRRRLA